MNRQKWTGILYWSFVVLFFAITTAGYMLSGEAWYDAGYYSALAFTMNYVDVENRNILLYIGRVLCPVMTIAGLLTLLQGLYKSLTDFLASAHRDATALYYEDEEEKETAKNFRHPVFMGKKVNKRVKCHVLMLKQDMDNLNLYEQMKGHLKKGSKVYIKIEKMESRLLKSSNVYYFNQNEIVARNYWKERNLKNYLVNGNLNVKIAILGFDALGQNLLDYGLMKNIYSLNQEIQYHIWGDSRVYRNLLGNFDKMNHDTIIYHDADWRNDITQLKEFDRIIVAQEPDVELLQTLIYLSNGAEIDLYNPQGADLAAAYIGNKLTPFGMLEEVLTEENIKTDKLYRDAKEVNFNYVVAYDNKGIYSWDMPNIMDVVEEKWEELDGFFKGSNVAAADYQQIRLIAMKALGMDRNHLTAEQIEVLKEMEHIRWSRYYFVNHWTYGEKKDAERRRHPLLIPYADLPKTEEDKDEEVIRVLLGKNLN